MQPAVTKGIDVPTLMCVATALSDKYGVDITVSGSNAYTCRTEKRMSINIPAVSVQDGNYAKLVRGYLDHEVGHARFTNWDTLEMMHKAESPAFRTISNIIEDRMVEDRMSKCFAGCAYNLKEIQALVFGDKWWGGIKNTDPLQQCVCYIMAKVRNLDPNKRGKLRAKVVGAIGTNNANLMDQLLDDHGYGSTADNMELASKLVSILYSSQDSMARDVYKNALNAARKDGLSDSRAAQHASSSANRSQRDLARDLDRGSPQSESLDDHMSGVSFDSMCAEKISVDASKHGTAADKQRINEIHRVALVDGNIMTLDTDAIANAMKQTTTLVSRLASLLKAYTVNRCGHKEQGNLDTRRIASVATGNTRVFHNTVRRLAVDTDVTLLVDASGSMDGERNDVTSPAIYAIMRALRGLHGVTSSAYALSGADFFPVFRRTEPVTARCELRPFSTTPLAGALVKLFTLLPSDNRRKLVIVMTDGRADDNVSLVLPIYKRAGVKVLCIGIQNNACTDCFPKEDVRTVEELSELPGAIFDLLQRNIVDNRTIGSIQ